MIRTRNLILNGTAQELTIDDPVNTPCTLFVDNTDNSKHAYLGTSSVTTSSYGIKLEPGQVFSIDLSPSSKLYGVGESTPVSILIIEKNSI
jgi:hypothetical protein